LNDFDISGLKAGLKSSGFFYFFSSNICFFICSIFCIFLFKTSWYLSWIL